MAGVMKIINNFKSNHMHGGKRLHAATITVAPAKDPTKEEPESGLPTDLMHRRRVSISKSGRYRENQKKRSALPDNTKIPATHTTASPTENGGRDVVLRDKMETNRENEKNKENEQKQLNSSRRESAISVTDGHAVADEIESLVRTIENGTKADLALT